jgi:DNA-binding transcriptional ArsR family regulator
MLRVRIGSEALLRCRFARSPLMETILAVRVLRQVDRAARYHLPWLDDAAGRLEGLDLTTLTIVSPREGWTPDFLSPPPERSHTDVATELARVRATPVEQVELEVRRSLTERAGEPLPDGAARLLDDPAATRDRLADLLEACWSRIVEPHWPRLVALLDADIAHRTNVLAQEGLIRVLNGLDPELSYRDGELRRANAGDASHDLQGDGLLLIPSAFSWPHTIWVVDPPWQPTVVYPARGVAELWRPHRPAGGADALGRLLGATRAMLLASLVEPASTRTLARRHDLAPATVSEHLGALAGAGLASRRRAGREVLYGLTDLGARLADPPSAVG